MIILLTSTVAAGAVWLRHEHRRAASPPRLINIPDQHVRIVRPNPVFDFNTVRDWT